MAYTPLYQKYFTPLSQKPYRLLKPESIKYKCFLKAISNYAINIDSGFDALYLKREDVCAIHLLRMLLDAAIKTYGILLAKNPDKYLNDYLKGNHKGDYASRSTNKYDGKSLMDGNILEYMDKDYPHISEYYYDANRYIHPSNFYCSGIELDKETEEWLWDSREKGLVGTFHNLNQWKERKWVYNVMGIINEVILDVMDKVVAMVEPPIVLPNIIDLSTGQIVPNPDYKEDTPSTT